MSIGSFQSAVGSRQLAVGSQQSAVYSRSTQYLVLRLPAFAIATRLRFATDGQADGQAVFSQRSAVDGFQLKIGSF